MVAIEGLTGVSDAESGAAAEAALIRAALAGDRAAMERLLAPHRQPLVAFCHGLLGNAEDAEDAAQAGEPRFGRDSGQRRGPGPGRNRYGLEEWALLLNPYRRPHWRFLAELSPAQRQEALSAAGLTFSKMSLAQQQQFIALAFEHEDHPLQSLSELDGAALRVDYTHPGGFQWGDPVSLDVREYAVVLEPGLPGRRALRPPVCERTREAVLQAARRIDPQVEATEIYPTRLQLAMI